MVLMKLFGPLYVLSQVGRCSFEMQYLKLTAPKALHCTLFVFIDSLYFWQAGKRTFAHEKCSLRTGIT